jgi:hypothetical protein
VLQFGLVAPSSEVLIQCYHQKCGTTSTSSNRLVPRSGLCAKFPARKLLWLLDVFIGQKAYRHLLAPVARLIRLNASLGLYSFFCFSIPKRCIGNWLLHDLFRLAFQRRCSSRAAQEHLRTSSAGLLCSAVCCHPIGTCVEAMAVAESRCLPAQSGFTQLGPLLLMYHPDQYALFRLLGQGMNDFGTVIQRLIGIGECYQRLLLGVLYFG